MGIGEDFNRFYDACKISTELIGSISYRYKRITRQLNTDFWGTSLSLKGGPNRPFLWGAPN
jgi:hypothetical protein